jgi:hypothetical protein
MQTENHQRVVYYIVRRGFVQAVKIGTTVNLPKRLKNLSRKYGCDLIVLGVEFDSGPTNHFSLEGTRHTQFQNSRIVGEWFWNTPDLAEHIYQLDEANLEAVLP